MNTKSKIRTLVETTLESIGYFGVQFDVLNPKMEFGDYSTNAAMVAAKKFSKNPREVAEEMSEFLTKKQYPILSEISVAGPGFINFKLSDSYVDEVVLSVDNSFALNSLYKDKLVMAEYTDPNPFKPFHIGHLMTNAIGESVSRIVELGGGKVVRANYQGDVGLHVAKAIWSLLQKPSIEGSDVASQAEFIGSCYVEGSNAYESDQSVKAEIDAINKKIYTREDNHINEIYELGRQITLDAFEIIYKRLGTKFDRYYFESEMASVGLGIVKANLNKVFTESDGAVVFAGKDFDPRLHTRVFVNSQGLPTYETKELGLVMTKFDEFPLDMSITTTAVEQSEYMKVVTGAINQINPEIAAKMKHIAHGMMKLASGKMSSRVGNIVTGESLMLGAYEKVYELLSDRGFDKELKQKISWIVAIGAIKFSILKGGLGNDIVFDFDSAVSLEGDSGPYLQYSVVRAKAVLVKADERNLSYSGGASVSDTELGRLLVKYPEVVELSAAELKPHYIVNYLLELASAFNIFYSKYPILDEGGDRLALTRSFVRVMEQGLQLLAIEVPEKM